MEDNYFKKWVDDFGKRTAAAFIMFAVVLASIALTSAEPYIICHSGVNCSEAREELAKYNLTGIKQVTFARTNDYWRGWYFIGGVIKVNVAWADWKYIVRHEIAHNYCWETHKYLGHNGTFNKCLGVVK